MKPTREQAIKAAGEAFAQALHDAEQMTPRELAEAAWSPTSTRSVDELEDDIRARRGLAPIHAKAS